jgi:hypothetical protein
MHLGSGLASLSMNLSWPVLVSPQILFQLELGKKATGRIWPIIFGSSHVFLHARAWELGKCAACYLFHVGDGRGLTFYCEVKLVCSIALTGDLPVVVNTFASTPADSSPPNLSILLISDGSRVVTETPLDESFRC